MPRRRSSNSDEAVSKVVIGRPVEEVFAYYTDLRHLPEFLGDVLAVEYTGPGTARWTVALPLGLRIHWTTHELESEKNRRFAFRTTTAGMTMIWQFSFSPYAPGSTTVEERMSLPGGRIGRVVLGLLGKHPQQEVESNLDRLRQRLESGRVTNNDNTMGKRFS